MTFQNSLWRPRAVTRHRDERGAATVLFLAALAVVVCIAGAVIVIAGYAHAAHRARGAADLAALLGASAKGRGGATCAEAKAIAAANGAKLVTCQVTGDSVEYVVQVTVERQVRGVPEVLPKSVTAQAWAGRAQ